MAVFTVQVLESGETTENPVDLTAQCGGESVSVRQRPRRLGVPRPGWIFIASPLESIALGVK